MRIAAVHHECSSRKSSAPSHQSSNGVDGCVVQYILPVPCTCIYLQSHDVIFGITAIDRLDEKIDAARCWSVLFRDNITYPTSTQPEKLRKLKEKKFEYRRCKRLWGWLLIGNPKQIEKVRNIEALSSDCEGSPTCIMISSEMLYSISSITFVGGFVLMFWILMWKYVFEPNPLVRDFFDLDRKPTHKLDQKRE